MGAALGGQRHRRRRSEPIRDVSQIPKSEFHIAAIDLTAGVMRPVGAPQTRGLTHLRQLYLPGPIWNPGGGKEDKTGVFEALATLTGVERLAFGWHFKRRSKSAMKISTAIRLDRVETTALLAMQPRKPNLLRLRQTAAIWTSAMTLSPTRAWRACRSEKLRRLMLRDTLVTDEGLNT